MANRNYSRIESVQTVTLTVDQLLQIKERDIVRYQTNLTGHRSGVVVGVPSKRDIKRGNLTITATIGVGQANRKKVVLTAERILEWRAQSL